jgi:hypothetical protein
VSQIRWGHERPSKAKVGQSGKDRESRVTIVAIRNVKSFGPDRPLASTPPRGLSPAPTHT